MTSTPSTLRLVRYQAPTLRALMGVIFREIALSIRPRKSNPNQFEAMEQILRAPSNDVVDAYSVWSGASAGSYTEHIPSHFFTQFALPLYTHQLAQTRYRIASVINQGCDIRTVRPVPRGTPLHLRVEVADITESNGRARVHLRMSFGPEGATDSVVADCYAAFIIGKRSSNKAPKPAEPELEEIGHWSAREDDGFRFALLTGDFNPIHWVGPLASRSVFRGKVLQGFGAMARTYESLQNAEGTALGEFNVRFVGPVKLPSDDVHVLRSTQALEEGRRAIALKDDSGQLLLTGQYTVARSEIGVSDSFGLGT